MTIHTFTPVIILLFSSLTAHASRALSLAAWTQLRSAFKCRAVFTECIWTSTFNKSSWILWCKCLTELPDIPQEHYSLEVSVAAVHTITDWLYSSAFGKKNKIKKLQDRTGVLSDWPKCDLRTLWNSHWLQEGENMHRFSHQVQQTSLVSVDHWSSKCLYIDQNLFVPRPSKLHL